MQQEKGLVWAVDEQNMVNFFTPRQCPRVYYRAVEATTDEDIGKFFSSSARHCIAIESKHFENMAKATIYLYELDPLSFTSTDKSGADGPGYYISEQAQIPLSVTRLDNLFERLFERNVEVRILPNLHQLKDAVIASTLQGGMMRTGLAQPIS